MDSLDQKVAELTEIFSAHPSPEARYRLLIDWGRKLPPLPDPTPDLLVAGCQSRLYIRASLDDQGRLLFTASSDALISAGLAALACRLYSGETPEAILRHRPDCFAQWGLEAALSPTRAQGLASLLLRIRREAAAHLRRYTEIT
jgi:cysteine desulfuration protein SufE